MALYVKPKYGLSLLAACICHKSIVVQRSRFLYCRQWV